MPSGREQHDCWGLFDAGLDSLSIGPQELAFSTRANSETDTRTRGIAELAAGGVRHGREGGPPSWCSHTWACKMCFHVQLSPWNVISKDAL